jgi:hypothetical protein
MMLDMAYNTPYGIDVWIRFDYKYERSEATHDVPAFNDFEIRSIEVTYPDGTTVPDDELEGIDFDELLFNYITE